MYVCADLVQGFCDGWIYVDPASLSISGDEIRGSNTSIVGPEYLQAWLAGFSLMILPAMMAYAITVIRRVMVGAG